jgi:hypothetical protein
MPATTIALGFGHLPQDHAKNTVLDVHLHLDHPATPLSLGERWGSQSTGAGFTLQQATESRMEAHLRACGCEWLGRLALEERMSGRIFTREEILARRPSSEASAAPVVPSRREPSTEPGVMETIRTALAEQDFEAIEGLRDVLNDEIVRQIASEWRAELPWEIKDAYAALLLDQTEDCVRPLFQDALRSPTVESRAYAVCVLMKDFGRFEAMLVNGGLDEAKVDAEVAALSLPRP